MTVIDSPQGATERIVIAPDHRGRSLARALGGRFIRSLNGYALTPTKAARWQLMFSRGLSAVRGYRFGPGWWFVAPDGKRYSQYTVTQLLK